MELQSYMNQNENNIDNEIINICKYLEGGKEDILENKEKNLYYFFSNKDIYNENRTKLKEEENYLALMKIVNQYIKEKKDFILLYFKKLDIDLMKIVFNGYITFDLSNDNQKKDLLKTIKNLIPLFFSKDLFYLIYNKLSKIFRRFNLVENKEMLLDKFYKTFELWTLMYGINNKEQVNSNYFTLIGKKVLVLMNIDNRNKYDFKEVNIYIEFEENICKINEMNNELIKVCYLEYGSQAIKWEDIGKDKENEKIRNIFFKINEESINYILNQDFNEFNENLNEKFIQIIKLDFPSNFAQIDILKNFVGKIKKIKIKTEFNNNKIKNHLYEIIPKENQLGYEIISFEEKEGITKLSFELAQKTKLISSKIYNDILYEDIRYYGGMECFVPIIKIIKYFITVFKENEGKIKKLNESLITIIRYIIKFTFYSENNFKNLKLILIPLLGSLAEINNVCPENMKNSLYSHDIFSLLYIIIINSSLPFAIKKSYMNITNIYNIDKLNFFFDESIFDINQLGVNSYKWYTTILIQIIEFLLLKLNDVNKIPKNLINEILSVQKKIEEEKNPKLEQVKIKIASYIKNSILILNYIFKLEKEENNLFGNCEKIVDISNYFQQNIINNKDNISLILTMIKIYLKINNLETFWYKLEEERNVINELNNETYKNILNTFFTTFENLSNEISNEIKDFIKAEFEDYKINKDYLIKIFSFLSPNDFKLESEIILSEFTDFHRDYHNLMKNLFIFNKMWSDKKLFFNEEKRKKYLKYKSINYYTKNYQKPFLFPVLDYKYSYPSFKKYKIKEDFYLEEENQDNYYFNLDCPKLDEFNTNYEEELLKNIKNNSKINSFDVCMVKRTHHIKGKLLVCNDNNSLMKKIIFYSYPKDIAKNILGCNSSYKHFQNKEKSNNNLCFGAIFNCPEKYMNIKIIIRVKDIRMILRRIYFYRKSAVEIFTENKSYYFNFADKTSEQNEKNCLDFINMFGFFISEFSPVAINKEIIGYSRKFEDLLKSYKNKEKKYDISEEGNKFILSLFEHWADNNNNIEFSTLDLLIYLNLLSNRSYNDLFQYPVFPLLFFYDKDKDNEYNYIERKLNKHIGFQDGSERAKTRKKLIKVTYKNSMKEYEELGEEEAEVPSYFSTHFSNNFYVSNFMIRLFPYSFLAIEQQGKGFDSPNRLFFSIEDTLFNISFVKSDLRELIPEFYYFPEMFWNLNKVNFGIRENNCLVDDVEMPKDINRIDKDKNKDSININNEYEKTNYYHTFKFIEKMRNLLESKQTDIISWINLIFGPKQKYKKAKRLDLNFRYESYIDYSNITNNELKFYRHDKTSLTSVEFGITPLQTVFEGDTGKSKNKNYNYNSHFKDNKELFKNICKAYTEKIKTKNVKDKECKGDKKINEDNLSKNKSIIKYGKGLYRIINSNNNKTMMNIEENENKDHTNIFLEPKIYINCIFQNENIKIIGYKTGKIEVYKVNEKGNDDLIAEIFDHKSEVNHINYNKRLNMFCTTSKDGFLNVYSLPNKLITTIRNPNKKNFNLIFLSSNPFPSIIVLEQESLDLFSYTINGFKIKSINLYDLLEINKNIKINLYAFSHFNENGGTFKDRLTFIEEKDSMFKCHLIRVPFFEKEERTIDIKI